MKPVSSSRLGSALIGGLVVMGLTATPAAQTPAPQSDGSLFPSNQWNICNETSYVLRVASALIENGKTTPRGWDRVRPGACLTKAPPPGSERYVYAESESFHTGRVREWKGSVELCVSDIDFKADASMSCKLQDLQTRAYLKVDPQEKTTTFIEPDNFGDTADTAGLQRLLQDNGYKISRVDGITGRRTSRTLNTFLKDQDISGTLSTGQKFEALIKGAQETQASIGLTLCNKSAHTIWSAIAYQSEGEWESRGWWPIERDACAKPFSNTLENTNAHFFALQEQPKPEDAEKAPKDKLLRTVAAKPRQFCVAEGVFSAIGHEYCADRGYRPVSFRPLPTEGTGTTVTLTDADFVKPSATGLRR